MANVIDGLYYSESHEYVKVDGEFGYVGITDFAQEQLGNVVYVDMPEEGDEVEAGKVAALGIEVELALVDVFKMPFQAGRAFVGAAPCRQEGNKQDEGCAEVVCEVHGLGLVALG